ncbi:tRNA lysidine(34) synthetase TilS [Leucobacter sp. W1153]|uniref:tRNA lysidine(34) synthetase TilS n=1 Tax=Leucobacter sp. W1153 TaxID=3439064 RepID=UPI003F3A9398
MTRLPPLDPAVARTRLAARRVLREWAPRSAPVAGGARSEDRPLVLVALSGGADSLALAAAVAFEAPRLGLRAGAVIVDHDLQEGSNEVAQHAAEQARALGLEPVIVRRVNVARGDAEGPEAAARAARYEALQEVRAATNAAAILTAHTRDDQAEQVLLALARGSGIRAIAGIPPERDVIHRPFLGISRGDTEQACRAQGLRPWRDPHNSDPTFARVRVRERVLPLLETQLGPGVASGLARSAELAREDADALDRLAEQLLASCMERSQSGIALPVDALAEQPDALRNRMIRLAARAHFGSHLSREHTLAAAALVTAWHGQGPINVPGATVERIAGRLNFRAVGGSTH